MSSSKDASNIPAPKKTKSKKPEKSDEEAMLDGLMTEIEEDLRGEEIAKLWKLYGNYVIAAVVGVILAVVGWQLWKQNQDTQRAELTRQYESTTKLAQAGKFDEALTAYAVIAEKKGEGLAALAQLQKAAVSLEKGDRAGALATYKALQTDSKADPLFRDLAVVLYALHGIDTENPLDIEAKLKPLLDPSNAFTHSAIELTALAAYKQGDAPRALKLVEGLAADQTTPQGVRQRADELATMFRLAAPALASAPAAPKAPDAKPEAAPSKP